jgi:hypothetical protein
MTLDEAKTLARIIGTADHGCSACVGNLVDKLNEAFPAFTWVQGGDVTEYRDEDGRLVTESDDYYDSEVYIDVRVEARPSQLG